MPSPDPSPIRGRWTITICDGCGQQVFMTGHAGQCDPATDREVEVVAVPDEAAIERGAKAAFESRFLSDCRAVAEAVLRAALETPDGP